MMSSFLRKRGSSNGKDHGESKAVEFQAIGVSDPTIQRSCWGFLFLLILKFLVVLFYLYLSRKYLVDEVYEMEGLRELDLSVKTTIVVIAPENVSHLKSFILHYSLCRNIHEIAVIWHSKDSPPELSSFPFQHTHSKVSFISNQEATLVNLLFEQRVSPVTESMIVVPFSHKSVDCVLFVGILLLDADVFLDCENVAFSVSVWSSSINSLVGYFPRTHRLKRHNLILL